MREFCIVEKADHLLVTPYGLRTLSPFHPAYRGQVGENREEEAGAWHNGVVHPWLIWPYAYSVSRTDKPLTKIFETFGPLFESVDSGLQGHISEAFEGDAPHRPLGVPASAVSLAAVISTVLFLRKNT